MTIIKYSGFLKKFIFFKRKNFVTTHKETASVSTHERAISAGDMCAEARAVAEFSPQNNRIKTRRIESKKVY